ALRAEPAAEVFLLGPRRPHEVARRGEFPRDDEGFRLHRGKLFAQALERLPAAFNGAELAHDMVAGFGRREDHAAGDFSLVALDRIERPGRHEVRAANFTVLAPAAV